MTFKTLMYDDDDDTECERDDDEDECDDDNDRNYNDEDDYHNSVLERYRSVFFFA